MKLVLACCILLVTGFANAKSASIGYELLNENQDGPTKTYTIKFGVWSVDKDVSELTVTPVTDSEKIQILGNPKTWKNLKKGRHVDATISIKNKSGEVQQLTLKIHREGKVKTVAGDETKTESFEDTKDVSVMVPAL